MTTPGSRSGPRAVRYFRVDARLIHATVMNNWVPTIGARLIYVVDNEVLANSKRRAILELSAMGVDVRFSSEEDIANRLAETDPGMTLLTLFSSLEGVERAMAAGLPIDRLNIGHLPETPGRQRIHEAVHLGPSDFDAVERLQHGGVEVVVQPLPSDKAVLVPRRSISSALDLSPTRSQSGTHRRIITPRPVPAAPPRADTERNLAKAKLRIVNAKGLHLRAAHLFAHLAGTLPCEVWVSDGDSRVNAKSLLGLTTLGATCGTELEVLVEGPAPEVALEQIKALFESGFEEGRDWPGPAAPRGDH